jgi:uncharacterized protein
MRFDMSDWHFQQLIWGGTNYATKEWTTALGDDDKCRGDRVSGSELEAELTAATPAPQANSSSSISPSLPETAAATQRPPAASGPAETSVGTGYVINHQGTLVTAYHVVSDCNKIAVLRGTMTTAARLVASDVSNDLAVLEAQLPDTRPVAFREGKSIRPADEVVVLGYPYAGLLATAPEVTTGSVTALAGIGNDARYLQFTAPIQPGNSGGPVLDLSGNVVGTVDSTLDPKLIAELTGSLPQNVNFAIKSTIIREFLDGNHIEYSTGMSTAKMDPADVGENAAQSVVMVECTK